MSHEFKSPKYWKEKRAQARKLTSSQMKSASLQALNQGVKLQARVIQFQDQGSRVQAKVSKLPGTGNKDKSIFFMSTMK